MSSIGCPQEVLRQAGQVWSMLDDLSRDDPEAYRTFIQDQTREGLRLGAPPRVQACLRAEILGPERGVLYVNVCSWTRVPAARDPGSPVPVCGGQLGTHTDQDGGGGYTVLDVAFSPSELQRDRGGEMDPQVCLLALDFAQRQHGLKLSERYHRVTGGPKGSLEDVYRRLGFRPQNGGPTTRPDPVSSPASLLQHISSLRMEDTEEDQSTEIVIGPKPAGAAAGTDEREENKNKKALIQVISSTFAAQQPQVPQYQLAVIPGAEGRSRGAVELTVELPRVVSMSQCQLSVSQEDVLLEVDDLYHLLVDLPEMVDEDSAFATFNKKERRLTLRVDVL
ncbi:unnamed protein product [Merluccius merluccius]